MAIAEDRRRLTTRLTVLRVSVFVVFGLLAGGLLVLPGGAARQVPGDGREQPPAHADAAGAARHHLRSHRPGAGREPQLLQHLDRPRAHQGSRSHHPAAGRGDRRRREAQCARSSTGTAASPATGRSSSSRTRRWRRWRRSPRAGSTSSCPTSSSRKCRRASIPTEALAAHLIGYVGEASEEQMADDGRAAGADRRAVGRRAGLQQAADGRGRRAPRGRQQHGPRDPHARGSAARPRAAACSCRSTTRCRRPPRRRSAPTATGARRWCSTRRSATC